MQGGNFKKAQSLMLNNSCIFIRLKPDFGSNEIVTLRIFVALDFIIIFFIPLHDFFQVKIQVFCIEYFAWPQDSLIDGAALPY